MTRRPAVAGMFYEADKGALIGELESCFMGPLGPGVMPVTPDNPPRNVIGLVCPHAGYIYSGSAAAHAYSALAASGAPDTIILLGPNHYGAGAAIAISPDDTWATPLGLLERDNEAAAAIIERCEFAREDPLPHQREHSLEVQLPFIQLLGRQPRIVPISIGHLNESDAALAASHLGAAIADALEDRYGVIIASTDFSHYESKARAETLDSAAISHILRLDPEGLIHTVYGRNITMCGVIGVAAMLEAAIKMGAREAHKLTYYTSGDVTGDTTQVVGYGALSVTK